MDDSADVVQKVLAAAAEDNGEFELPLKPERVQAMRAALMERRELVVAPPPACRLPLALPHAACSSFPFLPMPV